MLTRSVVRRVAAVAGLVGGGTLVAYTIVQAHLPEGCVGDQCDTRSQRPSSTTAGTLLGIGLVLVLVCGLGLLAELRARDQLGRLGRAGGIGLGAGFALLAAAGVAGSVAGDTWNGMPALVVPGVVAFAGGLLALGLAVLRSGLLPAWAAGLLVLGCVLLPFGNEENSTILRDIPFGVAWVVIGGLLLRPADAPSRSAETTQLVS